MQNLYPDRFPSFWGAFDTLVDQGDVVSVRESLRELDSLLTKEAMQQWAASHRQIFLQPTSVEMSNVAQILSTNPFQALISAKARMEGRPVADPFVIASAMARGYCVVTEEHKPENGARIPNACEHFGVRCLNFEEFLAELGWQF